MISQKQNTTLTTAQIEAARFLSRATMGVNTAMIDALVNTGNDFDAWLDAQKHIPATPTKPWMANLHQMIHGDYVDVEDDPDYPAIDDDTGWVDILRRLPADQIPEGYDPATAWYTKYLNKNAPYHHSSGGEPHSANITSPWMQNIVFDTDYLRQRVAWALSQTFVVSIVGGKLPRSGVAVADYWDTLTTHALGNFYDLLLAVSTHPVMAYYLSHLGNQKFDPSETNRTPDENFAREVMQLFTIGLYELGIDDRRQGSDEPVPTYDNETITALARVFTGLWFESLEFNKTEGYGYEGASRLFDLVMFEAYHDTNPKTLFPGSVHEVTLAADQLGMDDIEAALTVLFNHPNTPLFICQQLIRLLVTGNPSAEYIGRVANIFIDNGNGVRGDLHAVVKAILLDPEIVEDDTSVVNGKLIEPVVRMTRLVKAFGAGNSINITDRETLMFWRKPWRFQDFGQWVLTSPSVFNFYRPDYQHLGSPLADNGLKSPVFGIINDVTVPEFANYLYELIFEKVHNEDPDVPGELYTLLGEGSAPPDFVLDFSAELALADDTNALIDRLNLLLCYGKMTDQTRAVIVRAIEEFYTDNTAIHREKRVKTAVYITALSPDAAILR